VGVWASGRPIVALQTPGATGLQDEETVFVAGGNSRSGGAAIAVGKLPATAPKTMPLANCLRSSFFIRAYSQSTKVRLQPSEPAQRLRGKRARHWLSTPACLAPKPRHSPDPLPRLLPKRPLGRRRRRFAK